MTAPEKKDYKKRNLIYDTEGECWTIEDETEYIDVIKFKFPEDAGCTPFSSNPYYHHFIDASGLSYLGDYEDFKNPHSNTQVRKTVPMGYRAILVYERICLYDNGKLVFERNVPKIEGWTDKFVDKYVVYINKFQRYKIPTWGKNELVTCEVKVNVENKLSVDAMEELNTAQRIAKEYSLKYNAKCIVCRILEYENWH